jgi:inosine-uridine nucleoside N-ribohydrolase
VIETRHLHVRVETRGELTVGRTVIDTRTHAPDEPNARVAFAADARRFVELLVETFS